MLVRTHEAILETSRVALELARTDLTLERHRRSEVEARLMSVLDKIAAHAEAEANRKIAEAKTYTHPPFELPDQPRLPQSVMDAIEARSMEGTPERRILKTEAHRLLSQGRTVEEIRAGILEGEEVTW